MSVHQHLRLARLDDAAAIAALVNLAYRVEDFFIDGDRTNEPEIRAFLERDQFIVADDGRGRLVAGVHVSGHGERGHFGMLSVDPACQGNGLGRALVEAAERHCAAAGCTVMDIDVVNLREELPTFYAKLGYSECGTQEFPDPAKLKMPAHFILFSKPLAPALVAAGRMEATV